MQNGENTSTADQRRSDRRTFEAPVCMRLETRELVGQSENLSHAGLLFFSEEPLRVSVEVQEPGGVRTYTGRLIRVQRMSESSTGLAIEFDPE
jgi:hypothetical protein